MKTINIIPAALSLIALTSCHHKELCYDHVHRVDINVVFDWQNAPDATAKSMALYMYDTESGEHLRYIFDNNTGGPLSIPFGNYNGLCINSDNNDWAVMRNTDDINKFEIYTADVTSLEASGLSVMSIPRARSENAERMAATPGMVWSDRQDAIDLPVTTVKKTITMYPDEDVCHYTVDIYDVDNEASIEGTRLDATISGMAEGYYHGKKQATDNVVTMPFTMDIDRTGRHLNAQFLTFGECPNNIQNHILTVYAFLTDGSRIYYNFDVTKQVSEAPDPRHVHIIIHGLSFPQSLTGEGALKPDVDDWQAVYIDLDMNSK